jgi:hypothetical protein
MAEHVFETFLLTRVQNGPAGFEKKHTTSKKQYMCRMMIMLCQWGFNEQIEKLVRLSLYQLELFKKIPRLGTFCIVSK